MAEIAPKDRVTTINIKGTEKPWLPAHEAITWFREEHPGATSRISTRIEDWELKIVVAEIYLRSDEGEMVLVSTARSMGDGTRSLERLETSAIRRALAYLGYGTVAAMADDGEGKMASSGMTPEEQAQVSQAVHGRTPEEKARTRKNLGSGTHPRRIGGPEEPRATAPVFGIDFDVAYFNSGIAECFDNFRHRDNAVAKMLREGDLTEDMGEDEAISIVRAK